jgi:hypothetical protein
MEKGKGKEARVEHSIQGSKEGGLPLGGWHNKSHRTDRPIQLCVRCSLPNDGGQLVQSEGGL